MGLVVLVGGRHRLLMLSRGSLLMRCLGLMLRLGLMLGLLCLRRVRLLLMLGLHLRLRLMLGLLVLRLHLGLRLVRCLLMLLRLHPLRNLLLLTLGIGLMLRLHLIAHAVIRIGLLGAVRVGHRLCVIGGGGMRSIGLLARTIGLRPLGCGDLVLMLRPDLFLLCKPVLRLRVGSIRLCLLAVALRVELGLLMRSRRITGALAILRLLDIALMVERSLTLRIGILLRPQLCRLGRKIMLLCRNLLLLTHPDLIVLRRAVMIVDQDRSAGRSTRADRGGISRPTVAFGLPFLTLLLLVGVVPRLPLGIARTLGLPLLLLGEDGVAARLPIGGISCLPLLVLRCLVERTGAIQITRGRIGALLRIAVIERHAVGPVDTDQRAVVIGIAAFGIGHIERLIGARLVIIITLALRQLLDHAIGSAVRTPDPRTRAVIVDRVIGRALTESAIHRIGAVDIIIAVIPWLGGDADRFRRGGQGRRYRRRCGGRSRGRGGEWQCRDRRRDRRLAAIGRLLRSLAATGEGQRRQADGESETSGTGATSSHENIHSFRRDNANIAPKSLNGSQVPRYLMFMNSENFVVPAKAGLHNL
jgi:hypothetical protein